MRSVDYFLPLINSPSQKVIKEKISQIEPLRTTNDEKPGPSPVQRKLSTLRAELGNISNQQSEFKSSKQKIRGQIETLEIALEEHKKARQKMPFKVLAEIEAEIARLESLVDSDTMRIAEEKEATDTISALQRNRRALEAAEESISHKEAKIMELKVQVVDTPEQIRLNDRYNEISTEIKQLSSLWDEHTALRRLESEKINARQKLEREFNAAKLAYRAIQNAAYHARREKFRTEREAKDREYKRQIAAKKLAEASQPAFQPEINTCEGLIAHFDPDSPEAQAAKTKASLHKDAGLKALATRVVETEPKGKKLVREEEDYFIGKPKKGKRGSNKDTVPTNPANTTNTEEKSAERGKFQLNHGILVELGKVDVRAPSRFDEVPSCVEKLRERLIWYKENSERVTQEVCLKMQLYYCCITYIYIFVSDICVRRTLPKHNTRLIASRTLVARKNCIKPQQLRVKPLQRQRKREGKRRRRKKSHSQFLLLQNVPVMTIVVAKWYLQRQMKRGNNIF